MLIYFLASNLEVFHTLSLQCKECKDNIQNYFVGQSLSSQSGHCLPAFVNTFVPFSDTAASFQSKFYYQALAEHIFMPAI